MGDIQNVFNCLAIELQVIGPVENNFPLMGP